MFNKKMKMFVFHVHVIALITVQDSFSTVFTLVKMRIH